MALIFTEVLIEIIWILERKSELSVSHDDFRDWIENRSTDQGWTFIGDDLTVRGKVDLILDIDRRGTQKASQSRQRSKATSRHISMQNFVRESGLKVR